MNSHTMKRELAYAEEALIVDAQLFLYNLMEDKGVTRSQLAQEMGVSKARVSQIFSDECENLTLRLLARAAFALGESISLDSEHFRNKRIADEIKSIAINDDPDVHPIWERHLNIEDDLYKAGDCRLESFIQMSLQTNERAYG